MEKLKVEYVPTDELVTYENNAKIHTGEQIEQIKKSIQKFGFNDPIAVWKDNVIIEGHGRLIAAKELQLESVPIIRLDSLTDEQRKAYMLVHNQLTLNTTFDMGILEMELSELESVDMNQFGFDFQWFKDEDDTEAEKTQVEMKQGTYQIIVDCESETEMEQIYNKITELGIECRTSTL